MADIQNIKCKNQRKTSPNRRNFALQQEIEVGESNGGVYIYTGSAKITVSAHAQYKFAENGRKCD